MVTTTKTDQTPTREELTQQANQYLQANDLKAAYPLLSQLAQMPDAVGQTCTTAGLIGLTLGKVEEARQLFEQALSIAPTAATISFCWRCFKTSRRKRSCILTS